MMAKILRYVLNVAPERSSVKRDSGPLSVKRAIETSATAETGTPWLSTAMEAIMDVVMAARDPMAEMHLLTVSSHALAAIVVPVSEIWVGKRAWLIHFLRSSCRESVGEWTG